MQCLTGNGLVLEVAAVAVGSLLGVVAQLFMRVSVDRDGQAWTDAGLTYILVWVAITAARQAFIYRCQHWFTRDLGRFLIGNHISVYAFADSIVLLSLVSIAASRLTVLIRSRIVAARPVISAS